MNISGSARPQSEVRNAQCGDWTYTDSEIAVKSVQLSDWRYELLIQVHELVEAALCKQAGITDEQVTAFDALFEQERAHGLHLITDEDGDDPRAPYRHQHRTATIIEMILADTLDVDWRKYEEELYGS